MKLLMFMRDALPPSRVDVSVLFDRCLREQGILTDYVGPRSVAAPANAMDCRGRQFATGSRNDPRTLWREARLMWNEANRYDAIVVRDKPLWAAALFAVAALRRRPCIYWMSFPMPLGDRMTAARCWAGGRRVRGALGWLRGTFAQWVQDRIVLGWARHVFVQSEEMLAQVSAASRVGAERMTAVPMGIDASCLPARPVEESKPHCTTIAYLGSLDRARQLDVLVDALALVRERHTQASLMLVGWAPLDDDVAWLQAYIAARGLADHVVFTGALPMTDAWGRIRRAEVCVSPVPPGPLHDVSSPTKVVEYLALGLPVVANDIADQRALIDACGGGVCVAFTAAAFANAISALLDDPSGARAQALSAQPRVLALRSYDVLGRKVATALRAAVA